MTTRQSPSKDDDAALSLDEWKEIGREVLELKCNYFNFPITGTTSELAELLHAHYHPEKIPADISPTPSPPSSPNKTTKKKDKKSGLQSDSSDSDEDKRNTDRKKFGNERSPGGGSPPNSDSDGNDGHKGVKTKTRDNNNESPAKDVDEEEELTQSYDKHIANTALSTAQA